MNKTDELNDQYEDALVHYMTKCNELERQVDELKERVKQLEWTITEQD